MKKEKMVKTAKTLDTLCKVLKWVVIIGAAVCAAVLGVFTVVNAVRPDLLTRGELHSVDIGPLTLALAGEVAPDNNALLVFTWIMAAAAAAAVVVFCYAIGIVRRILAPMTQGDPFHPTVGKELRRLAFASLAIGIIQNVMGMVGTFSALHIFDLNALLQNSGIQSVTANFRYDLGFIVVFLVLLLTSHIFQYGEELQKLSDETL